MPLSDLLDSLAGIGFLGSHADATNTTSVSTGIGLNTTIANLIGSSGASVDPTSKADVTPSSVAYTVPGSLPSYQLASQYPGLNASSQPSGPSLLPGILDASVGGIPVWLIGAAGIAALLLIGGIAKRF